jgi:hypothetical protein
MKYLKLFIVLLVAVSFMPSCVAVKIDGKVSDTEAALIRTAVGSAFLVNPELAAPVFVISDTVLSNIDGDTNLISNLESLVAAELEDYAYTKAEKASIVDIFNLAVSTLYEDTIALPLDIEEQTAVVNKILSIIRASAKARI